MLLQDASESQTEGEKVVLWILCALGSVAGGFALLLALGAAKSAPQEAALAAMAAAFAVVPYVFARAVQMLVREGRDRERHRELLDALEKLRRDGAERP